MTERGKNLRFDLGFALCALIFALLVHFVAVSPESGGTRWILSDAQQLVTFAAGLDHPEAFTRDPLLGNPLIFGWYKSVHVPLIRWLAEGKDYGIAYEKLAGVHQFAHLCGFYLLGLCFLRRRMLAALFAVMVSLEFWFGWGTFWGSLRGGVPLPRVTYAALFSLLCAAMLTARRDCRFWPPIFLGMGALVHVHAISALGMGFAMWLGLFCFRPPGFSRTRRFAWMFASGICFLLPATPFILNFLVYAGQSLNQGLNPADLLFLREIATYRIAETFTRLGPQLVTFLIQICTEPPLLPLALAGIWAARRHGNERERELVPMLGLWTLGIVLTVSAFAVDHEIARRLGRPPLEYDMVRCIRFIPFFCFIATFLGFSVWFEAGPGKGRPGLRRFAYGGLGVATLALFLLQGAVRPILFLVLPPSAEYKTQLARERADGELIAALRAHTRQGDLIFAEGGDYLVRYAALRNLAFSHKDGVILLYSKQVGALKKWYPTAKELDDGHLLGLIATEVGKETREKKRGAPEMYLEYARKTGSDYLVLTRSSSPPLPPEAGERVWENERYVLLRLPKNAEKGAHINKAR